MSTHRPRKCFRAWAVDDRDPMPTYGLCWWCFTRFMFGFSAFCWWVSMPAAAWYVGLNSWQLALCVAAALNTTWTWLLMRTLDRVVKLELDAD